MRRFSLCLIVALIVFFPMGSVRAEIVTAPLTVVISEIAWSGTVASSSDEWIEIYNNTDATIDLTGWTLSAADGSPSISLSGVVPARKYFLLERTDDDSVPAVTADMIYDGALADTGENLFLRDATATIIDQVDCSAGWFAGHGAGYVPMARINLATVGDANNWTYSPRCGDATNSAGISHTCILTTTNVGASLDYRVYFDERVTTAIETTTEQTPMESALLNVIDNAAVSIDIALYGLDRQSVVAALVAAHNRGVAVRVIGDDDAAANEYHASYQTLVNAGITVVTDASNYIQHNKFVVVDGQVVWTGSTNFTDTCITLNANNSIVITSTHLAAIYTKEFDEMWSGEFHGSKSDDTAHLLDYNGTIVESYFSPTDLVAFEVWDELEQAESTVHFAMFFWTDDVLTRRTVDRLDAGVEVYGVWDQLGAANSYSADEALCAAGAHIKIEDFPGKVHHKFAVIDVNGDDPTVILGSYNWTDSGGYGNDENTLVIHDQALAQVYYVEWERLWDALDTDSMCNPTSSNSVTVTISGPETGALGAAYAFTATLDPITTGLLPINYTWEATGLAPVQHTNAGLTDTVVFTWTVAGSKVVTVTVGNTQILHSDQHLITIGQQKIYLPLISRNWPPYPHTPTLGVINNTDGDGAYSVSWTEMPARFATTYVLQEATDAEFTTELRTVCTTPDQSCQVTSMLAGTYYYRVKGQNTWGDSAWSVPQSAVVLLPDTPVLNSINNADGDGDYTVTWNAAARATSYTLQEDTDPAFPNPTVVFNGAQTSWTASGKALGTYYYRVIANGPTGQSGLSTIQSASVQPPGAPYLNPIDNADGDGNYTVTWNPVSGATSYILEEDDNAAFSSPQTLYTGVNQTWPAANHAQGTYYYRVAAISATGQSGWSNSQTATISPPADVRITYIEYDPDGDDVAGEYVRIENRGARAQVMTSWTLRDASNHIYTFPSFTLAAGATVRVWTKGGTNTAADLYWGSGAAIWNNSGDTADLRDAGGTSISTYSYP